LRLTILRLDSIDSTNLEAMRQARRGAPEGLCIVAREQTHGRGRYERVWTSSRDAGLYFSILLRPRFELSLWPLTTLMAAVAVSDALRDSCELQTDIKWPNDIVIDERKLCGILAETVETDQGNACILGIGINLREEAFPPALQDRATSVAALTGRVPDAEVLLKLLLEYLTRRYAQLASEKGIAAIIWDWTAASSFATGKWVRVDTGTEVFEGISRGLENDGALRVETDGGEIKIVHAGDVQSLRPVDH
jgi:BirA family transcriptional regulator, biotin operon repressor / biotin---[acetyl-CoA-carboxylase] ligase